MNFQNISKWINDIPPGYLLTLQLILIFFGALLVSIAQHIIHRHITPHLEKTHKMWDDALIKSLHAPLAILIWIIGVTFSVNLIRSSYDKAPKILNFIDPAWRIGLAICIVWFISRFVKQISARLVHPDYKKEPLDKTSVDAASKISLLILYLITVLIVLQEFGISISVVLASVGGGALVVGLAAKDIIANFFGGMMIFMDRPFSVGDWISSPDKDIEGTVEHIGWRLSRIRTFDMRPLYVPNSIFSTVAIENPSRMTNRRIYTTIGIGYSSASTVPAIIKDIEAMLKNHPEIDVRKTLMVKVVQLGNSSIDIMIYTFTKTTQWVKFQTIQQDVFLKIVDIIYNKHQAEISPTTYKLDMQAGLPVELKNFPFEKLGK